jgi:Na+-driven multidrug efflux pump
VGLELRGRRRRRQHRCDRRDLSDAVAASVQPRSEVFGPGAVYLRIVAPSYAALGFGFVIAFAAQGAGHVLWPFVGAASRLVFAAGGGWLSVSYFGGGMTALAAMVCASLVSYALICMIVMGSKTVWRCQKALRRVRAPFDP